MLELIEIRFHGATNTQGNRYSYHGKAGRLAMVGREYSLDVELQWKRDIYALGYKVVQFTECGRNNFFAIVEKQ